MSLWSLLSQATLHFITIRDNEFTVHKMSGLANRARYKAVKTMRAAMVDNFPFCSKSFGSNWLSSILGVDTCFKDSGVMSANSQYFETHLRAWPCMTYSHARISDFTPLFADVVLVRGEESCGAAKPPMQGTVPCVSAGILPEEAMLHSVATCSILSDFVVLS